MKLYTILGSYFPQMSIKQKLLDAISVRPKLTTFVMGLALTVAVGIVVGTALGMFDHQQVASAQSTTQSTDQSESNG
jgi:hypothetical protein